MNKQNTSGLGVEKFNLLFLTRKQNNLKLFWKRGTVLSLLVLHENKMGEKNYGVNEINVWTNLFCEWYCIESEIVLRRICLWTKLFWERTFYGTDLLSDLNDWNYWMNEIGWHLFGACLQRIRFLKLQC